MITAEGVRKIQRALLAAVILGFLSIYFCTMCDWIIMSAESTTRGFIQYEGGPVYRIFVAEIVRYALVHVAVILLLSSCFDFEDDQIPNGIDLELKVSAIWFGIDFPRQFVCSIPETINKLLILLFRYWRLAGCLDSFPVLFLPYLLPKN